MAYRTKRLMPMWRIIGAVMLMPLLFGLNAVDAADASEPKMLSGISVVGNNEAPKSLFIISWKDSEIGSETELTSGLLDDKMRPVDRDVFMRELDFYEIRQGQ